MSKLVTVLWHEPHAAVEGRNVWSAFTMWQPTQVSVTLL